MNDSYDGGDSYEGEVNSGDSSTEVSGDDESAFGSLSDSSNEMIEQNEDVTVESESCEGDDESAFSDSLDNSAEGYEQSDNISNESKYDISENDDESAFENEENNLEENLSENNNYQDDNKGAFENNDKENMVIADKEGDDAKKTDVDKSENEQVDYSRPTHWRAGMRDEVWENAKDEHGRVRDPVTGIYMSKDDPWDMGHKPGYEFWKHQESAKERGISRKEFLDEYYTVEHYRPELPSSNRSHKGENVTSEYFGD